MQREPVEQLLDAAAFGRIDRRSLLGALAALGASHLVAPAALAQAVEAGEKQAALRRALKKSYDYIVVGGGSAGCVVAAKLARDRDVQVLLIEAGGNDEGIASVSDPTRWFTNIGGPLDWHIAYAPQPHLDNRAIGLPRGKLLGGCGSINAMLWVRGHPDDYDRWAALGAPGWDWKSVLPSFKAIEDWQHGETALRGAGGPIRIMRSDAPHPISAALLEAGRSMGEKVVDDVNGEHFGGASLANLNIRDGARDSTSRAYLRPVLAQDNLTVLTGSVALRLLFDGKRCTGLSHLHAGKPVETRATREVILTAGAIETPKLLMLSGIGPAAALRALNIDSRIDHPEIGQNLQDHPLMMGVNFAYTGAAPPFCDNGGGAQLIASSGTGSSVPDLMVVTIQVPYLSGELAASYPPPASGFAVTPGLMRVESRGDLRLASADHAAMPVIRPNLLSTEREFTAMMRGIELCQELGRQPAYAAFSRPATPPGKLSRDQLAAYVRAGCATFFHPVGTCRMGGDDRSVVDPATLKLRGTEGLRIMDASVMPEIPTANTHAATIMIAERGVGMLARA